MSIVGVRPKWKKEGVALGCSFQVKSKHMQNTITGTGDVAVTVSVTFQDVNLVVSPFGKALRKATVERIQAAIIQRKRVARAEVLSFKVAFIFLLLSLVHILDKHRFPYDAPFLQPFSWYTRLME